jgi:uncharacterized protein
MSTNLLTDCQPIGGTRPTRTIIEPEQHSWNVLRDLATDESVLEVINSAGTYRLEAINLTVHSHGKERYISRGNDFGSIRGETIWHRGIARDNWAARSVTRTILTSTSTAFRIRADLDAYEQDQEGERRVFARSWDRTIPRDCV